MGRKSKIPAHPHWRQHALYPLTITAGVNGYRLAYVGGQYFETVGEYATIEEAKKARQEVLALTERFGKASTG
jgi:hypothetical protein